jgi:hypothetical protein
MAVVVDTDVVSFLFKGDTRVALYRKRPPDRHGAGERSRSSAARASSSRTSSSVVCEKSSYHIPTA